jgi:hypothetical protein
MFGQYGAETMALAAEPDSVLWTDDLIQGQLAKNEFGVKRAWTEVLVELATASGDLSKNERDRVISSRIPSPASPVQFVTRFSVTRFSQARGNWHAASGRCVDLPGVSLLPSVNQSTIHIHAVAT